jgi:hypothetical protein
MRIAFREFKSTKRDYHADLFVLLLLKIFLKYRWLRIYF